MSRMATALLVSLLAILLTAVFWSPLWTGGGLIGGDVYSYFLPQKVYYAEALQSGEFPLWNNRTGYGYPVIGESQTGVFYPINILLYSTLDVNSAYNASHLLHYVLAFLFTVGLTRSIGIGWAGAIFTATAFVYSWFPVRSCWEWAIVTGCWLPACLWCLRCYLLSGKVRLLFVLTGLLALQLLAGHFNLAFVTQLLLLIYALWNRPGTSLRHEDAGETTRSTPSRIRAIAMVASCLAISFGLTAFQLLPTMELKSQSQRSTVGEEHELDFGTSPARMATQLFDVVATEDEIVLWSAVTSQRDQLLAQTGYRTNQVEASLYSGIIPILFALGYLAFCFREVTREDWFWVFAAVLTLVHSMALLIPVLQWIPGFNYFQGPGRFSIVTSLAISILAGRTIQAVFASRSSRILIWIGLVIMAGGMHEYWLLQSTTDLCRDLRISNPLRAVWWPQAPDTMFLFLGLLSGVTGVGVTLAAFGRSQSQSKLLFSTITAAAFSLTLLDLWNHSRLITYSPVVAEPPISKMSESPIRRLLSGEANPPRSLAPAGNLFTIAGTSVLPIYLTFGPAIYPDENRVLNSLLENNQLSSNDSLQLRTRGVTHLIRTSPLENSEEYVTEVWSGRDPLFSAALGQNARTDSLYLYALLEATGRTRIDAPGKRDDAVGWDEQSTSTTRIEAYDRARVEVTVEITSKAELTLLDLQVPGWQVSIDGQPQMAEAELSAVRQVRVPAGRHSVEWTYSPPSFRRGWAISLATLILVMLLFACRVQERRKVAAQTD